MLVCPSEARRPLARPSSLRMRVPTATSNFASSNDLRSANSYPSFFRDTVAEPRTDELAVGFELPGGLEHGGAARADDRVSRRPVCFEFVSADLAEELPAHSA